MLIRLAYQVMPVMDGVVSEGNGKVLEENVRDQKENRHFTLDNVSNKCLSVINHQVNIREKSDIHQCYVCGDPHYHPLLPGTFGG